MRRLLDLLSPIPFPAWFMRIRRRTSRRLPIVELIPEQGRGDEDHGGGGALARG